MSDNKYPGYKLCFIDVETTGIDRVNNNIFQISAIITDPKLQVLDEIDLKFRPLSLDYVEDGALQKTGMTITDLQNLQLSAHEAHSKLISKLECHVNRFDKKDKLHFIAYNAQFDYEFMRQFFSKIGDNFFGSWFWNPPICVMQAAAWLTMRVRGALPNFKLGTLCTCAEIDWSEDDAHNASYDIRKTIELYKYIRKDIPQI